MSNQIAFYSAVLGVPVAREGGPGFAFGLLPHGDGDVGGCLYSAGEENAPSRSGPLVYLNVTGRLPQAVQAVPGAGGTVLVEVHEIGPHGFRAVVLDSEGNRVALHAPTV
jgi:uncharacterized protein